jgi:hypothetical protein
MAIAVALGPYGRAGALREVMFCEFVHSTLISS